MAENDLKAELAKVEKEIAELQVVRGYLRKRMGLSCGGKVETSPVVDEKGGHTGTLPIFRKGDFYGFPQAEAGYKVLECAGGSLTTEDILNVLTKSGYEIGGEDPKRTLYSSLCRSRRLVAVAPNTFDLAERRPQVRKAKKWKKEEVEKEEAQSEVRTQTVPKTKEIEAEEE